MISTPTYSPDRPGQPAGIDRRSGERNGKFRCTPVDVCQRELRVRCLGTDFLRTEVGIDVSLVVQAHTEFEEKIFARDLVHIDTRLRSTNIRGACRKNARGKEPRYPGSVHWVFSQIRWIRQ